MLKIKIIYFTALFAIALFVFGYSGANAATLKINSSSSTITAGETITLYVVLNSEGVAINNAEANIAFPTQLLDIVSISKSGSIFSLWVEEPYFSNTTGVITLNGGVPTPGFNGSTGPVVSIVVKAKKTGQADLTFSSAAVRANDGLGTDVLSSKQGKILSIVSAIKPAVTEISGPSSDTATVTTLDITSPTHPIQDQWYKDKDPIFRWIVPNGADAIQTAIDINAKGAPRITYVPIIKEKSVKDLDDGIWYFKVRSRNEGNWSPISVYVVRVDNTVPENKGITFAYDDNSKILNIHASVTDETSGLDYYEIYVNNTLLKKIPSADFVNGNYDLEFKTAGNNFVRLVAVDRAGNSIESVGTFHTTETISTEQVKVLNNEQLLITVGSFSMPLVYTSIIVILLVVLFVFMAFSFGRRYGKPHRKFKVNVPLDKGGSVKALSVLKKRLEKHLEILQHTRHNRVLSKEEKEIKEAIEVDLDEVDRAIEEQKQD